MENLVNLVVEGGYQGVLAVTGGGSGALYELLRYGGGSAFLLDGGVPYAMKASDKYLNFKPEHYCSPEMARQLAMRAYERAQECGDSGKLVGVGAACALAKKGTERAGREHKVFIAIQTKRITAVRSVILTPDKRPVQEDITARIILEMIAEKCGNTLDFRYSMEGVKSAEVSMAIPDEPVVDLVHKNRLLHLPNLNANTFRAILPGSFNPRHTGHIKMAEIGSQILKTQVAYEISVVNVDKAPLDYIEIKNRVKQFGSEETLLLTNAPTALSKARLLPGRTFLVGIDTWNRILNPKYCGMPLSEMFAEMEKLGTRFLVFGRATPEGFKTLAEPHPLAIAVPEEVFRMDISSTELRKGK